MCGLAIPPLDHRSLQGQSLCALVTASATKSPPLPCLPYILVGNSPPAATPMRMPMGDQESGQPFVFKVPLPTGSAPRRTRSVLSLVNGPAQQDGPWTATRTIIEHQQG